MEGEDPDSRTTEPATVSGHTRPGTQMRDPRRFATRQLPVPTPGYPFAPPRGARNLSMSSFTSRRAFTLVELMVVIAIITLLASVLATSVVSKMSKAKHDLDRKTLNDLYNELQVAVETDDRSKRLIQLGPLEKARGEALWEGCFKHRILHPNLLSKLVSAGGPDVKADSRWIDDPEGVLPSGSCSWTAPIGEELGFLMRLTGKSRRVIICFNQRNWENYNSPHEVLVFWSEGDISSYLSLDQCVEWGYEITPEQWEEPATELFGQVRPFDGVHE